MILSEEHKIVLFRTLTTLMWLFIGIAIGAVWWYP